MKLSRLPRGSRVFIDSNIFTYHLSGHSRFGPPSSSFLERVETGYYRAYVNDTIFSEVLLNFIKSEFYRAKKIRPSEAVKRVKKSPALLEKIDFNPLLDLIESLKLGVISSDFPPEEIAELVRTGLLPNDALHVLAMRKAGLRHIATNDRDFGKIKGIKVWKP